MTREEEKKISFICIIYMYTVCVLSHWPLLTWRNVWNLTDSCRREKYIVLPLFTLWWYQVYNAELYMSLLYCHALSNMVDDFLVVMDRTWFIVWWHLFEVQYIFCMYILKVVVVHTSHLGIILCQFSISHNESCLTWGVNFETYYCY